MKSLELFKKYVNDGAKIINAKKVTKVIYSRAMPGSVVKSYNGNGELEAETIAEYNQWILTKSNNYGVPILNKNGQKVQWLISDEAFRKGYVFDEFTDFGVATAKGQIRQFVVLKEDTIVEAVWGQQNMKKGDYLCSDGSEDTYGVAKQDFEDTYKVIDI